MWKSGNNGAGAHLRVKQVAREPIASSRWFWFSYAVRLPLLNSQKIGRPPTAKFLTVMSDGASSAAEDCFTAVVPVTLRGDPSHNDRWLASACHFPPFPRSAPVSCGCSTVSKALAVAVSWQARGAQGRRDLVLQLTDDTDPFFLYTLRLSEDDFAGCACACAVSRAYDHSLADVSAHHPPG